MSRPSRVRAAVRTLAVLLVAASALAAAAVRPSPVVPSAIPEPRMPAYRVTSLTPVLVVDRIEPVLPFWERLGFARTAEVPHGDGLGFVILAKDGIEVMYQTLASVADDHPTITSPTRDVALFIEVSDLDAVVPLLAEAPVAVPRRTTFYGMHEVGVREPAGNLVMFAQPAGE